MDLKEVTKTMKMELREPKRKKRSRLRPQQPFPINIGNKNEWMMFTGHLSTLGVCVVQPQEINTLHSMGFFGKGSLSRSFPNFGKPRYGAPAVVRNRQWSRRQEWLETANKLETDSFLTDSLDQSWENIGQLDSDPETEKGSSPAKKSRLIDTETTEDMQEKHSSPNDIIEISEITNVGEKQLNCKTTTEKARSVEETEVDEVVLYSTEEEDVCEITMKDSEGDIIALNDDEQLIESGLDDFSQPAEITAVDLDERELLVLPDSDSDNEDYLTNIKPRVEKEGFPVREMLHLTFEETFFLMFGLGCLQLVHFDGNFLNIKNAWNFFCSAQSDFLQKYVVYHYFRSKGWVVKPGLKYGGDFLLYKQGPPFYHASYIVIVEVVDADTLIRDGTKTTRKMTWNKIFGLDRLSETAAKEILFAQVLWPSSIPREPGPSTPEVLSEFTVRELLWRRWIPNQNREEIYLEEDDESS